MMMRALGRWLLVFRLYYLFSKVNRARVICWNIISPCLSANMITYFSTLVVSSSSARILPGQRAAKQGCKRRH